MNYISTPYNNSAVVLEQAIAMCQCLADMHHKFIPQLIVALDVDSISRAAQEIQRLPTALQWVKIGLELFCAEGPAVMDVFHAREMSIFLDLKLHDIPRTVERAVKAASKHRAKLLTIHASGGRAMIKAAAQASKECGADRPKILAVTALTSLHQQDLTELGVMRTMPDHVRALAELAMECGADGIVCSPLEAAALRHTLGPDALIVTPGIRAAGEAKGDQQRTCTAAAAVRAGATHLVVGRPILEADDPTEATERLLAEIRSVHAAIGDASA